MTTMETLAVFEQAAGVSTVSVSYTIRALFCAMFLIWGGWSIYGLLHLIHQDLIDPYDFPMTLLRIFCLCAAAIVLVFVN